MNELYGCPSLSLNFSLSAFLPLIPPLSQPLSLLGTGSWPKTCLSCELLLHLPFEWQFSDKRFMTLCSGCVCICIKEKESERVYKFEVPAHGAYDKC